MDIKVIYTTPEKTQVIMCSHVSITHKKIVCYGNSIEYVIIRVDGDKVEVE